MEKYCSFCLRPVNDTDRLCPYCNKPVDAKAPYHLLRPGTLLQGRYYIGAALGQGGFGITYAGYDTQLHRKVAIKEYYPNGFVSRNNTVSAAVVTGTTAEKKQFFEKGKQRFLNEARTLAGFSGIDGIVNVMDCFPLNNTVYIIMEYLEGITLKQYLDSCGKIDTADAINLLMPVMQSLKQIHASGLIHRDISPDNIILLQKCDKITAKLIDFGAARDILSAKSRSMTVMMKPGFAPLEQYTSTAKQGPWTDVYALCATIYYCITGKTPPAATDRIPNDKLQRPSALGINTDPHTEAVLLKGLSVLEQDRYGSIDLFLQDLFTAADAEEAESGKHRTIIPKRKDKDQARKQQAEEKPELTAAAARTGEDKKDAGAVQAEQTPPIDGTAQAVPVQPDPERSEETQAAERTAAEKRKKRLLTRIACALLGVALVLFSLLYAVPKIRYTVAAKKLEQQDFDAAVAGFSALGNFGDSAEMAKESTYRKAVFLMENERYSEATPIFGKLQDYKNSRENQHVCVVEDTFLKAVEAFNNKQYNDAVIKFKSIRDDKKEAADYVFKTYYCFGKELFADGDYKNAAFQFSNAGSYEDAEQMTLESYYLYGWERFSGKDYKTAYEYLTKVKDYKDMPERYNEVCYQYGCALQEEKQWLSAIAVFDALGGYSDSKTKLLENKYAYSVGNRRRDNAKTYEFLSELKAAGYQDSDSLYKELFGWKAKVVFNDDAYDTTTASDIDKDEGGWMHVLLSGGPPSGEIQLKHYTKLSSASLEKNEFEIDGTWSSGDAVLWHVGFDDPGQWCVGTLSVKIYDKKTGELIGEGKCNIVN